MADLVIDKKFVSAFFGTNLAGQLAMVSADTVVLCGAKTGGEIRQCILDALGLGFRGIVSQFLYQFYQILGLTQIIITGCG